MPVTILISAIITHPNHIYVYFTLVSHAYINVAIDIN